jgi:hypothetical protein
MSAMPPIATQSVRRNEASRCAKTGCEQSQQGSRLFDDLVGTLLKMKWHIEAERLGGFKIDH